MKPIERLLDEIAEHVRQGSLGSLAQMSEKLDLAVADLSTTATKAELERLRAKAEKNLRFLDAARRGIKAAKRRVDDARTVAQGLQTYDVKGKRSDITIRGSTTSRF